MTAAFAPWHLALVLPLALQPLLTAFRTKSAPGAALLAYLFVTIAILAVCHWIYAAAVGILGAQYYGIALAAALAKGIPFAIAGASSNYVHRHFPHAWIPGTALFFTLGEWINVSGNLALPFATFSLSQLDNGFARFIVPNFGALGLTFYSVATACFLNLALARRHPKMIVAGIAVCFAPYFSIAIPQRESHTQYRNVSVTLVQGRRLKNLSPATLGTAGTGASLVVWPEDAIIANDEIPLSEQLVNLRSIARQINATLLVGVAGFNGRQLADRALSITPSGEITEYLKQRLVPFAEYIPYKAVLGRVFPMLDSLGQFQRGVRTGDFTTNDGKLRVRPLICYEGAFHDLLRDLQPAQVVAVITDDSWFHDASGPQQQIDALRMRASETGAPTLVSGTTGPSGLIDGAGEWHLALRAGANGARTLQLPDNVKTRYSHIGNWGLLAVALLWLSYAVKTRFSR